MRTVQLERGATTPGKYDSLVVDEQIQPDAPRGQVLVMFAIFLTALMGILGLATDVGYTMAAKRSVQGAADAGALAGARMIARYTADSPTSAADEVSAVVQQNTLGSMTPTIKSCEYLKGMFDVIPNVTCSNKIPTEAAGVRVKLRGTYKTWFIQLIPGAPNSVTVGGYAKARVENATKVPADAPFIICGTKAWDVTANPTGSGSAVGTTLALLTSTSPMKINPSAVGKTFRVNDADLSQKTGVNCGATDQQFTGLSDQGANAAKSAGSWFTYLTSGTAKATKSKVDGAGGCAANTAAPYDCVMLLPIASNASPPGNAKKLKVIGFAAFQISQVNEFTYNAKLLDDYIVSGSGGTSWCRDCGGTVVIRLIW